MNLSVHQRFINFILKDTAMQKTVLQKFQLKLSQSERWKKWFALEVTLTKAS